MPARPSPVSSRCPACFAKGHARDIPGPAQRCAIRPATARHARPRCALFDRRDRCARLIRRSSSPSARAACAIIPGRSPFPGGKIDPGEDAVTAALTRGRGGTRPAAPSGAGDRHQRCLSHRHRLHRHAVLAWCRPLGSISGPIPSRWPTGFRGPPLGLLLDPASWTTNEVFWRGEPRGAISSSTGRVSASGA